MKIVNIIGGLGNQMFQYAFALSLRNKFKAEEILLDTHHFNHYGLHNGFELNHVFFNIELKIASKEQLVRLTRYIPHFKLSRFARKFLPKKKYEYLEYIDYVFDKDVFSINGDCYYEGYWQAYSYYSDIKDEILYAFKFPKPNVYNQSLLNDVSETNSVGIHVRRGDYLNHKDFKGICELDYYKRAISELMSKSGNYKFYIFSNDIEWCQKNIQPLIGTNQVFYVTENRGSDSCWDMYLMSKCRNLIIANSSFSWWGAFLNIDAERIYVPSKWVNREYETEIYAPNWIKI